VNHFLQRTHCRRKTDLMPTYAPSWEQTFPPPPFAHGGVGTLTHRENEGAGPHVLPAESGQQLTQTTILYMQPHHFFIQQIHHHFVLQFARFVCSYMYECEHCKTVKSISRYCPFKRMLNQRLLLQAYDQYKLNDSM
jgi:hypothetical protein